MLRDPVAAAWAAVAAAIVIPFVLQLILNNRQKGAAKQWQIDTGARLSKFDKWHQEHFDHAKDHRLHTTKATMPADEVKAHIDALGEKIQLHAEAQAALLNAHIDEDRRVQRELAENGREVRMAQAVMNDNLGQIKEMIRSGRGL